jgi:aspartyl-tRNA(Asn)/glutamyl-tRNA(Gln) amidotransferase subunit A
LNQHDDRDPTSLSPRSRSRIASYFASPSLSSRLASRPLRVGVPIEYNISELAPSVRHVWLNALAHLEEQGHTIHPVSLPATKLALSAYYVLAPAEASSNLAKYDGVRYGTRAEGNDSGDGPDGYLYAKTRGQGFGAEVKRRILLGAFSLSAGAMDNYFIQAQKVRRLVQADFDAVFDAQNPLLPASSSQEGRKKTSAVDVLIAPTAPSMPPRLSLLMDKTNSLDAYLNDVFTVPASLAGLPAVSIPVCGTGAISGQRESNIEVSEVDPVGLQIIGQFGDDELVLKVGEMLENDKLH